VSAGAARQGARFGALEVRDMKNRKEFLATVAATGAALLARGEAPATTPTPAASGGKPSPAPQKPPSAAALAVAATMRRFDPKLSDAEIAGIAKDIDESAQLGAALNPKKKRLRNSDGPVTIFTVPQR
jgi:hypothetical protein